MKAPLLLLSVLVGAVSCQHFRSVCYYSRKSITRLGIGKFTIEDINPFLCSHLIYSSATIDKATYVLKPENDLDIKNKYYAKFNGLKQANRNLKTIISIDGSSDQTRSLLSKIGSDGPLLKTFTDSVINFLKQHKFDGIDLRWLFLASSDKQKYVAILRSLREALNPHGFLLSVIGTRFQSRIDSAYDVPAISSLVDFINVWSFSYHDADERIADHHAPLYSRDWEFEDSNNVNATISYYIEKGTPPSKLNLGISTTGQTWKLASKLYKPPATAFGPGEAGPFTKDAGSLAYFEICMNVKFQDWSVVSDPTKVIGPIAYSGNQWVSYDDPQMAEVKTKYAIDSGLGGVMVWGITSDDFQNVCGNGNYPVLSAISKLINESTALVDVRGAASSSPNECGRHIRKVRYVAGGQPADKSDWPWLAALLNDTSDIIPFCGGSLITDRHVLTAAHCLNKFQPEKLFIRLGETGFSAPAGRAMTNLHTAKEFHIHPNYDMFKDDMAIVELLKPVTLSDTVKTICMQPLVMGQLEGKKAIVTGWGKRSNKDTMGSSQLQQADVDIWKQADCRQAYGKNRISFSVLCAAGQNGTTDACEGDSGGPLMHEIEPNKWIIVGVVAWGPKRCGGNRTPGVYTRVSSYLDWIDSVITQ